MEQLKFRDVSGNKEASSTFEKRSTNAVTGGYRSNNAGPPPTDAWKSRYALQREQEMAVN